MMTERHFSATERAPLTLHLYFLYVQGHGMHGHGETVHIPFPFDEEDLKGGIPLP